MAPTPTPTPTSRTEVVWKCPFQTIGGQGPITVGCGDERGYIIKEYVDYGVSFVPACYDFTQTASSAHFTFAELNSGDYSWAIIRQVLLDGLETARANYGNNPLVINSGYRNPAKQFRIDGGASLNSRHVYGDAADIASNSSSWAPIKDAAKAAGACVEPQSGSGSGHVHADWRGSCPPLW